MTKIADITPTTNRTVKQTLDEVAKHPPPDIICIGISNNELYLRSSKMNRMEALWIIKQAEIHILGGKS